MIEILHTIFPIFLPVTGFLLNNIAMNVQNVSVSGDF